MLAISKANKFDLIEMFFYNYVNSFLKRVFQFFFFSFIETIVDFCFFFTKLYIKN